MACREGIEPPTHSLEGCCSIQLSYRQMGAWPNPTVSQPNVCGRGGEIRTPDPLLPKQMRYQAALHPERAKVYQARLRGALSRILHLLETALSSLMGSMTAMVMKKAP